MSVADILSECQRGDPVRITSTDVGSFNALFIERTPRQIAVTIGEQRRVVPIKHIVHIDRYPNRAMPHDTTYSKVRVNFYADTSKTDQPVTLLAHGKVDRLGGVQMLDCQIAIGNNPMAISVPVNCLPLPVFAMLLNEISDSAD